MGSTFARNKKGRKHPKSGYAQAESKQSNRDGYYFVRQQISFPPRSDRVLPSATRESLTLAAAVSLIRIRS